MWRSPPELRHGPLALLRQYLRKSMIFPTSKLSDAPHAARPLERSVGHHLLSLGIGLVVCREFKRAVSCCRDKVWWRIDVLVLWPLTDE